MRGKVRLQVRYRRRADLALAALAMAALLAGLIGTLIWRPGTAAASPTQVENTVPLQYYLTSGAYRGDQVLSACAPGYHMASLWEIVDTSNLRYNSTLGSTRLDSGHGPPTAARGWVRTGSSSDSTGTPGFSNCHAWTSGAHEDFGSRVYLPNDWTAGDQDFLGWAVEAARCEATLPVWCVGVSVVYLPLVLRG